MSLASRFSFLRRYLGDPNVVGAVAPSSRALAAALCEPMRRAHHPRTILEVGAGTGAITRYIGTVLQPEDELDICEIQPDFADILERDVLSTPSFSDGVADGRIRLLKQAVQDIDREEHYDFVISGLPLTAFELEDVENIFATIRRCLKPDGVLSYFEYVGMRRTSRTFALGPKRGRIRNVSAFLTSNIHNHQFARRTVLQNFPPAYARHLRFTNSSAT